MHYIDLNTVLSPNKDLEDAIRPYAASMTFSPKQNVNIPDDEIGGMYYIYKGRIRYYMLSKEGAQKNLYFLNEGWLFGEAPFLRNRRTELFSQAENDVEIWRIKTSDSKMLMAQNQLFRDTVLTSLSYKVLYLRQEIESLSFDSCKKRLLHTLFTLVDNTTLVDGAWYNLISQYSHYELAIQVGSVRVTVSKLINELCKEGALRVVNHNIQMNASVYQSHLFQIDE